MFDNQARKSSISLSKREMNPSSSRFLLITLLICLFVLPIIIVGLTATAANADSSAEEFIFMPVALNGYFEGSHQDGISGRVLAYGSPLADAELDLRRYDEDFNEIIIKTTKTNEAGYYLFQDIDSLRENEKYYVSFGRNDNPKYVYFWYGPSIDSYNKGDTVFGGIFDVADVPLVSPGPGAAEALPINFRWEKRGLPGDSYRLMFIDFEKGEFWRSKNLGDVDSFTLEYLEDGLEFGKKYEWYVEVYMGPDNYGESFMINEITFLQSNSQQKSISEDVFTHGYNHGSARGGR
jgi:hypothetical protein